jgi:archaellum component FlaC
MEDDVRERFERIEGALEKVTYRLNGITDRLDGITDGLDRIAQGHLELEAAQKNTAVLLNKFIEESNKRGAEVDERIANLTILVDQRIKKNFNGH